MGDALVLASNRCHDSPPHPLAEMRTPRFGFVLACQAQLRT
jgi:hypothetical protein